MDRINRRNALKAAAAGVGLAPAVAPTKAEDGPSDQKTDPPPNYLILSCDGGGMRGILTALIIKELNDKVPFLDRVNLFAGTSTGAMIALGLANGMSPTTWSTGTSTRAQRFSIGRAQNRNHPDGSAGSGAASRSHAPEIAKHLGFELKDLLRTGIATRASSRP